jgi:ubiquinone/menaquinone biosynthesis C-methylase UbiE
MVPSGSGQEEWQLEGTAAVLYQRCLVPAVTALWAEDLVGRARLVPGERVLDVACGTGVVAGLAAERVGRDGEVVGLDVNAQMLAVARSLPDVAGATIDWREGSALSLPFSEARFDCVLCQLGLQFFPDRLLALTEMKRVLKPPNGRLGVSVYGPIEHNPATLALSEALDRQVDGSASVAKRTEHALADAAELQALIASAGFREVVVHTVVKSITFASPAEYVRIQLSATPLAAVMSHYGKTEQDRLVKALVDDVRAALSPFSRQQSLVFPQEVHVALARR